VDPRVGLDDLEKSKFLALPRLGLNPSVDQSVARSFIDLTKLLNFYIHSDFNPSVDQPVARRYID
jgi:hypothetical protein